LHTLPSNTALVCPPQKPIVATGPSAAEKECTGVSPNYCSLASTHAGEGQAERSGQAERNGEGGFGGLKAKRSGQAECSGEGRSGDLPAATIQLARTPKKAKPSAAAGPGAEEKGGSGVFPDYDTTLHAHAQKS
jgi:hypothetical protein